jgi:hypothetical protein
MRPAIVVAVILSLAIAARADADDGNFYSGKQLWEACRGSRDDQNICIGYIAGVADALISVQGAQRIHWFCIDPDASLGQIRDAVRRWLGEHPEKRKLTGASVLLSVLKEDFPCRPIGSGSHE